MSMLAERKQKQRWSLNPRGKQWSEDSSKFGQKLLEKMGWKHGKGLGANEDGSTEHIKVNYKNDQKGMGYQEVDQLTVHEDKFTKLLTNLNGDSNENEIKVSALHEKAENVKTRINYHKYTKGKDLSRYSEKDLANIFGKKTLKKEKDKDDSNEDQDDSNKDRNSDDNDNNDTNLKLINKGSLTDYFKNKLPYFNKVNKIDTLKESESESERCGFGFDEGKSKRKFDEMDDTSTEKRKSNSKGAFVTFINGKNEDELSNDLSLSKSNLSFNKSNSLLNSYSEIENVENKNYFITKIGENNNESFKKGKKSKNKCTEMNLNENNSKIDTNEIVQNEIDRNEIDDNKNQDKEVHHNPINDEIENCENKSEKKKSKKRRSNENVEGLNNNTLNENTLNNDAINDTLNNIKEKKKKSKRKSNENVNESFNGTSNENTLNDDKSGKDTSKIDNLNENILNDDSINDTLNNIDSINSFEMPVKKKKTKKSENREISPSCDDNLESIESFKKEKSKKAKKQLQNLELDNQEVQNQSESQENLEDNPTLKKKKSKNKLAEENLDDNGTSKKKKSKRKCVEENLDNPTVEDKNEMEKNLNENKNFEKVKKKKSKNKDISDDDIVTRKSKKRKLEKVEEDDLRPKKKKKKEGIINPAFELLQPIEERKRNKVIIEYEVEEENEIKIEDKIKSKDKIKDKNKVKEKTKMKHKNKEKESKRTSGIDKSTKQNKVVECEGDEEHKIKAKSKDKKNKDKVKDKIPSKDVNLLNQNGIDNPTLNISDSDLMLNVVTTPILKAQHSISRTRKNVRFSKQKEEYVIPNNYMRERNELFDINTAVVEESIKESIKNNNGFINNGFDIRAIDQLSFFENGVDNPCFQPRKLEDKVNKMSKRFDNFEAKLDNDINEYKSNKEMYVGYRNSINVRESDGIWLSFKDANLRMKNPAWMAKNKTGPKASYKHRIKGDIFLAFKNCNLHEIPGYANK